MNLFYRKYGEGPPFIILHGLFGSSDNWMSIGKILSERFMVFLIDIRNHGNSPHSEEFNYTLLKNDILDFMLAQNIDKAIIMGHSMGGKAAMFFAADYPEKVQSLIIVDISPGSYLSIDKPSPQSLDHMNILTAMLGVNLPKVKNREEVDKLLAPAIKSERIRRFLLKNIKRDHDNKFSWKLNVQALHDNLPKIMEGLDTNKFIKGNGVTGFPILFVKGEQSDYINNENLPLIKIIFPTANIVTIPGAGHWVHAEQPELFIKTINDFLGIA